MQVISSSPLPALLPYLVLCSVFFFTRLQNPYSFQLCWNARKTIMFFITTYLALVFFQTGWQTAFGVITLDEGISAIVNFVLPVAFYVYFRSIASEQEFQAALIAIIVAGLVVGVFFVYDSYSMMVLKEVSNYSLKALEYIELRAPNQEEVNLARVSIGYRSHGLLEKHAVSAGWIVQSCFAALTLLPKRKSKIRVTVILLYGMMLLIALNFTAMLGFIFVIILIEFKGYKLFFGIISKQFLNLLALIFAGFILIILTLFILPNSIGIDTFTEIYRLLDVQTQILTGSVNTNGDYTYVGGLINSFITLPFSMVDFPLGILIGMGFSTFSHEYGGDYGIVDNITRLGFPFFLAILIGLSRIIMRAMKKIDGITLHSYSEVNYLWFAITMTIYMIFADLHYSILVTKSLMPIFFLNLAIFDRYLYQQSYKKWDV